MTARFGHDSRLAYGSTIETPRIATIVSMRYLMLLQSTRSKRLAVRGAVAVSVLGGAVFLLTQCSTEPIPPGKAPNCDVQVEHYYCIAIKDGQSG